MVRENNVSLTKQKEKITKIYPLKQAFEFRRMILENQLLIRLEKYK
jgi:hypothetical protein